MIQEKLKSASIVDLLTIITPFVIIMGLMHKIGIYTSEQINASWFISIFTPIDFMISDLTIYFYFATSIIYLEKVIFTSERAPKVELFWANLMLISAYTGIFLTLFLTHKPYDSILKFYVYIACSLNGFGFLLLSKNVGKLLGAGLILLVPYHSGLEHAKKVVDKSLPIIELNDKKNLAFT
ncbi:hypothetical protein I6L27_01180 [Acinetobacter pittii]|uniref:hypothetical protein n=1 Tax=Acinetobacter pittii TaxID=48296 RepID=UPI001C216AC1|nr:hypothetical protein [Acinetobacter pittii]QXA08188.1 hypothetical protein I6L27_01180 [Acinetobacter pittii]